MGLVDRYKSWRKKRAERYLAKEGHEVASMEAPSRYSTRYYPYLTNWSVASTSIASQYREDFSFLGSTTEDALHAASALYSAVTANSSAIGALPPVVQRRARPEDGGKAWVDLPDGSHPLHKLLDHPMGKGRYVGNLPSWTWQQLMETISIHSDIVGNAFLTISKYGGELSALVPVQSPGSMGADLDSSDLPYRYTDGKRSKSYSPSRVVNIMLPNPASYWRGLSPLEAAIPDTVVVKVAKERQAYNLKNRVGANVIFRIGSTIGASNEQFDEMKSHLSDTYQESTQDGLPMVLGKSTEVEPLPSNESAGKDILEARKVSAQEILSIYKVPGELIGNREGAALQKFDKAILTWAQNFIMPSAARIYGAINRQAIWPVYGKGYRIWFSEVDSLAGLLMLEYKTKRAKELIDLGYPTNMAANRVDLGMPYHEALDVPNVKWVIAGRDIDPTDPVKKPEEKDEAEESGEEEDDESGSE